MIFIKNPSELVTTKQETRAGFIEFSLEKNRRSKPFIESAKVFKYFASQAKTPSDLLSIKEIKESLLTVAGLSDKALGYFTEDDKYIALNELIKNFLEPAGDEFVEEAVYRYLLMKGDTLGGRMRNIIGYLSQQKLTRTLLSVMSSTGSDYLWFSNSRKKWYPKPNDDYGIESDMKAISWKNKNGSRILFFNLKIQFVNKNGDLCLYDGIPELSNVTGINASEMSPVMFGELKGGIDPAGADEHWKTANTALNRVRETYEKIGYHVLTSFVGAAIETSMASEIYSQLKEGTLSFAANLTKTEQLCEYCKWLLAL